MFSEEAPATDRPPVEPPAKKTTKRKAPKKTTKRNAPEKTASAEPPKKRGRPKGKKTTRRPVVLATATRCPACGSSSRGPYRTLNEQERSDIFKGEPYTHIVRRVCICLKCGQTRIDRTYENRAG